MVLPRRVDMVDAEVTTPETAKPVKRNHSHLAVDLSRCDVACPSMRLAEACSVKIQWACSGRDAALRTSGNSTCEILSVSSTFPWLRRYLYSLPTLLWPTGYPAIEEARVVGLSCLTTCFVVTLFLGDQGHLIRIHAQAIMYDAADLPLTNADYDIWASGLRNPFRLDIFKPTGDIYIADVGHITVEVRWLAFYPHHGAMPGISFRILLACGTALLLICTV